MRPKKTLVKVEKLAKKLSSPAPHAATPAIIGQVIVAQESDFAMGSVYTLTLARG